jgi:hypothetical protein
VAKTDIAAVLALLAALFIAISDAVQQRLAHDVTDDERVGAIALFTRLLRNPRWWLGSLIAAVGFALQAAALGLGSVVLVQALFVTSLLFALPISAKLGHRKVTRSEWTWAVNRGPRPLIGTLGTVVGSASSAMTRTSAGQPLT